MRTIRINRGTKLNYDDVLENIDNLEYYLENHFDVWMEKYAHTPEGLAHEMKSFAEMEMQ